ncbi:MAG: hypothetical protein M9962_03330 [Oligoflexia bacterium]|nr:hypothetical protein [Oligoflexia bacterium]
MPIFILPLFLFTFASAKEVTYTEKECKFLSNPANYKACNRFKIPVQEISEHTKKACASLEKLQAKVLELESAVERFKKTTQGNIVVHEDASERGRIVSSLMPQVEIHYSDTIKWADKTIAEEEKVSSLRMRVASKITQPNEYIEKVLLTCVQETFRANDFASYLKMMADAEKAIATSRISQKF